MSKIFCNGLNQYYEQSGKGPSLVFIHGAFGDAHLWDPQWEHFSASYSLLRYDLRGHGRTGASDLDRYSMATYADDLTYLLDALKIDSPVICGLSWGGGIAQVFALRYPERLSGLVLAGSTASMGISLGEKLMRYVLFPRAAMMLVIRTLSREQFVNFSLWLASITLGKKWLNEDERTLKSIRQCMLQIDRSEYLKIWDAIYTFDLQLLEKIHCPTLVLTGERDNKMVKRHAQEILRRIPGAEARVLPSAYHGLTMEQPQAFNQVLEEYLQRFS